MIKVHNRKFTGLSFAPAYDIVITPATRHEGMWWWKEKTLGWAIVQTVPEFHSPGDVTNFWRVIFWSNTEEQAIQYYNKMDLLNVHPESEVPDEE